MDDFFCYSREQKAYRCDGACSRLVDEMTSVLRRRLANPQEVRGLLDKCVQNGLHVDDRLFREIDKPGTLSWLAFEREDEFLRLVWQAIDDTRPLTPHGESRTLKDCAARLAAFDWNFAALGRRGFPWFERCVEIDLAFDFAKFCWVAVTPLAEGERKETPNGNFYVYDGVHKSIVLAKKIIRRELQYRPLEVLLLEPRRS